LERRNKNVCPGEYIGSNLDRWSNIKVKQNKRERLGYEEKILREKTKKSKPPVFCDSGAADHRACGRHIFDRHSTK
jgi:hypothetical protein